LCLRLASPDPPDPQDAHGHALQRLDALVRDEEERTVECAPLKAQLCLLHDQLDVQTQITAVAEKRATLTDSSAVLYREEIGSLKADASRAVSVQEHDQQEMFELAQKVKVMDRDAERTAVAFAQLSQAESEARSTLKLTQYQLDEAREALEASKQSHKEARELLREYEGGTGRRLRKLESELSQKAARIEHQREQMDAQGAEIERVRAGAEARELQCREDMARVEAALEVRVRERAAELKRELDQASAVVAKMGKEAEQRNSGASCEFALRDLSSCGA